MHNRESRVLVCGPVLPQNRVNGLRDVLTDLVDGLRQQGWNVDSLLWPHEAGDVMPTCPAPAGATAWLFRCVAALPIPDAIRLPMRILLYDRASARESSALFEAIENSVRSNDYVAVLACLQTAPIGIAALVTRIHPHAILLSMPDLAREVRRRRILQAARSTIRLLTRRRWHPDLYRPVDPRRIFMAVFASTAWREAAVRAGVPRHVTRVIHFGVGCPSSPPATKPPAKPARLLWAGRLSPLKGLHLYLPAIAVLSRDLPVHLTVVAGEGDEAYRAQLHRMIRRLRLEDVVAFREPVDRDDLPGLLSEHDALLFFSKNQEPVAQVLFHAFASGLVVVGPESSDPRSALRPDRTAFCFSEPRPRAIASAINTALTDFAARERIRRVAFEFVRAEHSLDGTGARYDLLLRAHTAAAAGVQ